MVTRTTPKKRTRIFRSAALAFFQMKGCSNALFNFHVSHTYMLLLFRNHTFPQTLSPTIHIGPTELHKVMVLSCGQNTGKSYNVKNDTVSLENVGNFEFGKGRGGGNKICIYGVIKRILIYEPPSVTSIFENCFTLKVKALWLFEDSVTLSSRHFVTSSVTPLWPALGNVTRSFSTQRRARKLISGHSPTPKPRLLSFDRTQTRVVRGLPTGHNTLRRHLYLMGLINNPLCRRCGSEEETSVHILSECEALASLSHAHLGSYVLGSEDVKSLRLEAIWNLNKGTGSLDLVSDYGAQEVCFRA